jgi:GTPase SAR1 family protein
MLFFAPPGYYYQLYKEKFGDKSRYQSFSKLDMALFQRNVEGLSGTDMALRFVILGGSQSGRTSFFRRFFHDEFEDATPAPAATAAATATGTVPTPAQAYTYYGAQQEVHTPRSLATSFLF